MTHGVAVVLASLTLVGAAGGALASPAATVTVRVDATDFAFRLSRSRFTPGTTVRFVVRNRGSAPHDFVLGGRRTPVLAPGRQATLTVRLAKAGRPSFLCSVPGHAALGMRGRLTVARAGSPSPPPPPAPPPPPDLEGRVQLTEVGSFVRPVFVSAPPGDVRRQFVVEQAGIVRVVRDGVALERPFLDLRDRVKADSSEPGLLSLAFAPDYATSRRLYVVYNARQGSGDIRLVEYRRHAVDPDVADPGTARTVLEIPKPWENHNGGMLQFGPDGFLYLSVGDGDSGVVVAPGTYAQSRDELLGDILRIDPLSAEPYAVPSDNPFVGEAGVRPEVWAYGLRNPWRFWIDQATGAMVIADVGEGLAEELDLVPAGASGLNFGWPCLEGGVTRDLAATCPGAVDPLLEIRHAPDSCSIIGGVTVRDPRLPALDGRYLWSDFCGGRILSAEITAGVITRVDDLGVDVSQPSSFGVDASGRVYVTTLTGAVYRLDPEP